jgi:hypothetical protein
LLGKNKLYFQGDYLADYDFHCMLKGASNMWGFQKEKVGLCGFFGFMVLAA